MRSTPTLTPAQAFAARWDLSPNPAPRITPFTPRGATAEPSPPNFRTLPGSNVQKSSSVKEGRRSSKIVPLALTSRGMTFDELQFSSVPQQKQEGKIPVTKSVSKHSTLSGRVEIGNKQLFVQSVPSPLTLPPIFSYNTRSSISDNSKIVSQANNLHRNFHESPHHGKNSDTNINT